MGTTLFLTYGLLCLLVAYIGRHTIIGFWGTLLASVLLSPFVMALILLVAMQRRAT